MADFSTLDSDAFDEAYKDSSKKIFNSLFEALLLAKTDKEKTTAVQAAAAGIKNSRTIHEECMKLSKAG